MDMSAEADLLRRAQAGDNEASETLYRDFFEKNRQIHNLLLREVPAPEDREDILHDAFLSLIRSKSEFRWDSRLQTFVYRVVQVAILQKLRSDRARRRHKMVRLFVDLSGETLERELAVTDYGFEQVESEQMAERMYALLPEPLRTALRLRVNDDLSYLEVARRMDSPVNTAATRIFKARAILYKLFGGTHGEGQTPPEENLFKSAKKTEERGN
jgi:RNA polymerase sigma-70 factor (ECF subfamily)